MSKTFSVKLISPTGEFNIHNVSSANIHTDDGLEVFLTNHQPDSYHLIEGKCTIIVDKQYKHYLHSEGHAKFENNILTLSALKIKQL